MDIGTLLLMVAFAYGLGVLWYDLLPGVLSMQVWRVAAYPFAGIVIAEALVTMSTFNVGPAFGGIHILPDLLATLIAVVIDWIIETARQPRAVEVPERLFVGAPTTATTVTTSRPVM